VTGVYVMFTSIKYGFISWITVVVYVYCSA
jgi:hypothetical protein